VPVASLDAGFTLIEMLVVIVILGLTAAILLAHGPPHSIGMTERVAASEIVQSLRAARGAAIARGAPSVVALDTLDHRLLVDGVPQQPLPASLPLLLYPNNGPASRAATFVFAADGSARGGTILLGGRNHGLRIAIDWLTGRIDVSRPR
jgi:general secretion pathway protein H